MGWQAEGLSDAESRLAGLGSAVAVPCCRPDGAACAAEPQPLQAPPGWVVNHHPINRIAFDFPDTVSAAGKQPIEVGQRGLRSIQVVQGGTRTRLVLKLDRPFVFATSLEGKELLITLRRPRSGAVRDAMRGS